MSAALDTTTQIPALNAALDITLEAPSPIDVEITIYGGLDPETDELVLNARRAAEKLDKEYGIYAIVVPKTMYWGIGPTPMTPFMVPILVINGHEVASGAVLEPEEIVEKALALLGVKKEDSLPFIPAGGRNNTRQAAVATW